MTRTPSAQAQGGTHQRHLIFATVAVALFMTSVDQTIVATALPAIGRDLHTRLNWTAWIITIYSVGRITVMPLVGRLGEMLGPRAIFVSSVAAFTATSLLCGLATNIAMLIVLRGLQALGGGAFVPSATGLVADHFGPNRDRAVGMFTSIFPMGAIVGPILGGFFVSYWTWRGIFFINVPIGIVVLIVALKLIPGGGSVPGTRMDVPGSLLLCAALLSAIMAATYLGDAGHRVASPAFLGLVVVAMSATVTLVGRSGRPGSILPRRLLRGHGFGSMNVINVFYGAAAVGFSSLVPLYAQDRYGMSSVLAGSLLTARAVGMIAVSAMATMALRRTGYRAPMVVGFSFIAAGLFLLSLKSPGGISAHAWLSVTSLLVGVGVGAANPASNNAALELDPTQVAAVSGMRITFRQLGAILAVSVTSAAVSRSGNPGMTLAHTFVLFAVVMMCIVPLVRLVPDHHGGW